MITSTTALARICWTPYLNNPKLQGKMHIYVGSADTYYLTDSGRGGTPSQKSIYDEDLIVLIEKHIDDTPAPWALISLQTTAGTAASDMARWNRRSRGGPP